MSYDTLSLLWVLRIAGGLTFLLLLRNTVLRCVEESKIRRLGEHAARIWPWDLWGLYFTYSITSHAMRDQNLMFMHNCFHTTGKGKQGSDTFEVRMGGSRFIMTANLENIKAMLSTQFKDFGKGERFQKDWRDLLGRGIFASDGKAWHDARQRLRPIFTRQRVADLTCFERHLQDLLPVFDGESVLDIKDLMSRFAMDVSSDFTFGRELNTVRNCNTRFLEAFDIIRHTQSLIERAGPFNIFIPRKSLKASIRVVEREIEPSIQEAIALSQKTPEKLDGNDSASTFVQQYAGIAGTTHERQFLRDEMMGIMIAGRDTTAMSLSWCFYELARHPTVVAELRRSILETVGLHRRPTQAELKSMKIVSNILNETLRLYPVTPFNVRASLRDTTLPRGGGEDGTRPIGVPANTTIYYCTHLLHLSPDMYPPSSRECPAPDQFAPSRWDAWTPKPWTYIPFNGGPRICIGQMFALTQMAYVIVRFFQEYSRVELVEDSPQRLSPDWCRVDGQPSTAERFVNSRVAMISEITLSPKGPINVRFAR